MNIKKLKKILSKIKCCDNCANCQYIGEGDYICDVNMVIVKEEHSANENYNYCNECDWEDENDYE